MTCDDVAGQCEGFYLSFQARCYDPLIDVQYTARTLCLWCAEYPAYDDACWCGPCLHRLSRIARIAIPSPAAVFRAIRVQLGRKRKTATEILPEILEYALPDGPRRVVWSAHGQEFRLDETGQPVDVEDRPIPVPAPPWYIDRVKDPRWPGVFLDYGIIGIGQFRGP